MIAIVTWLWGGKYAPVYVHRLARGLSLYLHQPYRFIVMTDRPQDLPEYECRSILDPDLLRLKGCFARLRMFDPKWQAQLDMFGERIVCIDLDTVITGQLDALFNRAEPFVILQGANASNPCPYTACLFMLRAGMHAEVWEDFSLEAVQTIRRYEFPDDQGWLWHKIPKAAGWNVGKESGIWSFRKRGWPANDVLPQGTRMVAFPGARDPSQFTQLPWIKDNWFWLAG